MIFALAIVVSLAVAVAVLYLEQLGDPKTLEREYGLGDRLKDKSCHK